MRKTGVEWRRKILKHMFARTCRPIPLAVMIETCIEQSTELIEAATIVHPYVNEKDFIIFERFIASLKMVSLVCTVICSCRIVFLYHRSCASRFTHTMLPKFSCSLARSVGPLIKGCNY